MLPMRRTRVSEDEGVVEVKSVWDLSAKGPSRGSLSMTNAIETRLGSEPDVRVRDMTTVNRLLAALQKKPGTLQQLSWRLGWGKARVWSSLDELLRQKVVVGIGVTRSRRGPPARIYGITPDPGRAETVKRMVAALEHVAGPIVERGEEP